MAEKQTVKRLAVDDDDFVEAGCCPNFRKPKKGTRSAANNRPKSSSLSNRRGLTTSPVPQPPLQKVESPQEQINTGQAADSDKNASISIQPRLDLSPIRVTDLAWDPVQVDDAPNNAAKSSDKPEIAESEPREDSTPTAPKKREIAEQGLKESAAKLDRLLPQEATERQIHEAIAFQVSRFEKKDVEDITKGLGQAIGTYMDQRIQLKQSRSPVKIFVQKWFMISYPYIQMGLRSAGPLIPPPYGLVVTGVLYLVRTAHDANVRSEQVDETILYLSKTMDSIQSDHQSTAGIADEVIETIQCAAINLSAAIMDCLSTALSSAKNRSGSSPSLSILLKTFTEKPDLVNARLKVKEAVEAYNTAAIHLTTAVLLQNKREERKKDVLEWIWEGEFDSEEKHKLLVENHIPETGKWFLESNEVQGWQGMTEDSASMIICSGIAGAGKTYITSATIEEIQRMAKPPDLGVAYFYFDYRNHRQRAADFVRCILKQLLYQLPQLPEEIDKEYEAWDKGGRKSKPDGDKFVILMISCAKKFKKGTFVIVDALDECLERLEEDKVIGYLKSLYAAGIRLFITTRPHILDELDLRAVFGKAKIVEISAKDDDVETYLRKRLSQERWTKGIPGKLKQDIVEKIKTAAVGMFLLAKFQLDFVLDKFEPHRMTLMKEALNSLPTNFEEAYGRALQAMTPGQKEAAFRVMSWIFHARRPLRMKELQEALAIDEDKGECHTDTLPDPKVIVAECASLIVHDKAADAVGFAHYTVQEYLRDQCFDKLLSSNSIAKSCLIQLGAVSVAEIPEDKEEFVKWLDEHQFAQYVVYQWGSHIREEDVTELSEIDRLVSEVIAPAKKRQVFLRIEQEVAESFPGYSDSYSACFSEPFIHILARKGLATLCKGFLERIEKKTISSDFPFEEMDVEIPSNWAQSPLITAAEHGFWDVAKVLIEKNADVKKHNAYYRQSVLHLAARAGAIDLIRLVLARSDDPEFILERDFLGYTCLTWAIESRFPDIIELFLTTSPDLVHIANNQNASPLHQAATIGQVGILKLLLKANAVVEIKDVYELTPLHRAAQAGNTEALQLLLDHGAQINVNPGDGTPLLCAARAGSLGCVKALVSAGANLDEQDQNGRTALHEAATYEDSVYREIMELLVKAQATVDLRDKVGETPLFRALTRENIAAANILFQYGADPTARREDGDTPLHDASRWLYYHGNTNALEFLLEKSTVDINAQGLGGATALHCAAGSYGIEPAKLLLEKGAFVNARSDNGETPLHWATNYQDIACINLLLENKAWVNASSTTGRTPLSLAATVQNLEIMNLLLEKKAYVNARGENGDTPLHITARTCNIDLIRPLMENNPDVNAHGQDGYTPLHLVVAGSTDIELAQLLVEKGADLDAITNSGETALHIAVNSWNEEMMEFLLDKGGDRDAANSSASTALHMAASGGYLFGMRRLVQSGANVNMIDINGNTPLHLAAQQNNLEMVQLLLENGANISMHVQGYTVLHAALDHETFNQDIIEMLARKDPFLWSVRSKDSGTPIDVAEKNGHKDDILLLSELNVLPSSPSEVKGKDGGEPIMLN